MLSKRFSTMLLTGAALAGMTAAANASLVIDVKATNTSAGAGPISGGGKSVNAAALSPGSTITFDVVGIVTPDAPDADLNNEAVVTAAGSFLSTNTSGGSVRGTLAATKSGAFTGNGSSNGLQTDLDGDGDLDVGSNGAASANYFTVREANGNGVFSVAGAPVPLGTVTMTLSQVLAGGTTNVNFLLRALSSSGATWKENGALIIGNSTNLSSGAPVAITGVPEPTTIGLASLAGLGLLARRRK